MRFSNSIFIHHEGWEHKLSQFKTAVSVCVSSVQVIANLYWTLRPQIVIISVLAVQTFELWTQRLPGCFGFSVPCVNGNNENYLL